MISYILPLIDFLRSVHQKIKRNIVVEADFPKFYHLGFPATLGIERAILNNQKIQVRIGSRRPFCVRAKENDLVGIDLSHNGFRHFLEKFVCYLEHWGLFELPVLLSDIRTITCFTTSQTSFLISHSHTTRVCQPSFTRSS